MDDLLKRARLAQRDERMSTGALYGELADRIEADAELIKLLGKKNLGALELAIDENKRAESAEYKLCQAHARIAELEAALRALLRFVENTESEMGIVLGSADLARAALGEKKE